MIQNNLFIQTGYSFNGSLFTVEKLVQLSKNKGYKGLGIADFNNMYGAIKFYELCKKENMNPLIGIQTLMNIDESQHIPMLIFCFNNIGYQTLLAITSLLNTTSNSLEFDSFSFNTEGLSFVMITTYGPFYNLLLSEQDEIAFSIYRKMKTKLPELYLGIDSNDLFYEMKILPRLANIGKTILCNYVIYENQEDKEASQLLRKVLKEQGNLDQDGMFDETDAFYDLKEINTLTNQYCSHEEAVLTMNHLFDKNELDLDFSHRYFPKYTGVSYESGAYLNALSFEGLRRRLKSRKSNEHSFEDYHQRLLFELDVIHSMNYDDYFLIVWDFVLYAKKSKILVGPGRGSAAGSLVAYCLGITDIDPLMYDLYFERFLNPQRISMPDIDMDFPDIKRDQVIQYVKEKYGKTHVTSIVTFGTFQGKSALRDVARVLGMPETLISEISSYIADSDNSIETFIQDHQKRYDNLMKSEELKQLFEVARKYVGLPRHISTHAAGVIISDQEITKYCPIQNGINDMYQTQYEASDLEKIGLLKIDFLGLRNLTTIQNIIQNISDTTHEDIDVYKIPLNDKKTIKLFQDVSTLGIFQFESSGMMNLLRKMQIQHFDDISLALALFRPGPMENIPLFLNRRFHKEKTTYLDPVLEPILKGTEGIMIYQEQIMRVARDYAGYTLGEADVLRRAVSKKKESILLEEREKFIQKSRLLHRDDKISNLIYDDIVKFANYGFNKSHSVVYSLVAYWMAYLKANYSSFFMSTLLDASIGSKSATSDYIKECRKLGINVLPPDINHSHKFYTKMNDDLVFPLLGIKNLGSIIVDRLEQERSAQNYRSFIDFMRRNKGINSKVIESMIMVGMFDGFSQTKQTLIQNLHQVIAYIGLPLTHDDSQFVYIDYPEYDYVYLQKSEKELLGLNLRYHPLNQYDELILKQHLYTVSDIQEEMRYVRLIAWIDQFKAIKTKNNKMMAFLTLEDSLSSMDAVVFPTQYSIYQSKLMKNQCAIFEGKIELRNNQLQMTIDKFTDVEGLN